MSYIDRIVDDFFSYQVKNFDLLGLAIEAVIEGEKLLLQARTADQLRSQHIQHDRRIFRGAITILVLTIIPILMMILVFFLEEGAIQLSLPFLVSFFRTCL